MEEEILEEEVEDMEEVEEEVEEEVTDSPLEATLKQLEDIVAQLRQGVDEGRLTTEDDIVAELTMMVDEMVRPPDELGGLGLEDATMEGVPPAVDNTYGVE